MSFLDTTLARRQRIIDELESRKLGELAEKHTADENQLPDIEQTAAAIEAGSWEIKDLTINFARKVFFGLLSLIFPENLFECQIDDEKFQFYSGQQHGVHISVNYFQECPANSMQAVRQQYYEKMAQSKQKTIWIEEREKTTEEIKLSYLLAQHPMPRQDVYNLIALYETQYGTITLIFSVFNENHTQWLHLFKAMLQTTVLSKEE